MNFFVFNAVCQSISSMYGVVANSEPRSFMGSAVGVSHSEAVKWGNNEQNWLMDL